MSTPSHPTAPDDTVSVDESQAGGTSDPDLPSGTALGRYILQEPIGAGGMGVVYAAHDPQLDRRVAIKLLRAGSGGAGVSGRRHARLLREAHALARLAHPNVVAVYDVGTFRDRVFIALELVEGCTLHEWLRQHERPWREVLKVCLAAGRGLAAAHAAGLIHRDFKPDNVLIGKDGRARVTDFGLARALDLPSEELTPSGSSPSLESSGSLATPLTRAGAVLGTPGYMAPEQVDGSRADARADQFSFCITTFEALYGVRPFQQSAPAIPPPPKGSKVPAWLHRVLSRGLGRDPSQRFHSMIELLAALGRDPAVTRRRWLAGGAATALVAALAAGTYASLRAKPATENTRCQGIEQRLAGSWDPAIARTAEAAFLASGQPSAAQSWRASSKALNAYAAAWGAMAREACESTHVRGEQSEQVLSLRTACLEQRLEELKILAGALAKADAALVERAPRTVAGLSALQECADVEALRAPAPTPPSLRAKVDAARAQLAAGRAWLLVGKPGLAQELAREALAVAHGLRERPLEAEALLVLGDAQDANGESADAEKTYREAVVAAQAGRHDAVSAEVALRLVHQLAAQRRLAAAQDWARQAEAAIERLGGSARLQASLADEQVALLLAEGKHAEAIEQGRKALALREQLQGAEHLSTAASLRHLADALRARGSAGEAEALEKRAIALEHTLLGR